VAPHYERLSTQDVNNLWADATESPMLVPDLDTVVQGMQSNWVALKEELSLAVAAS
jgi:hypothetical protein